MDLTIKASNIQVFYPTKIKTDRTYDYPQQIVKNLHIREGQLLFKFKDKILTITNGFHLTVNNVDQK